VSDFTDNTDGWDLYDGPGHNGAGRRSPSAAVAQNGVLTITGSSNGTTEGMAWGKGQRYGRWEARIKSPEGDGTYHPVMLLWPDAENWPVGGEVDFMEISDASRNNTDFFLHYGRDNNQVHGNVKIDATEWHNWAVEWTPKGITGYVDGKQWFHTDDTSILPPGPMHMTLQLDWFPEGGNVKKSLMYVDWARQYPYRASSEGAADAAGATGATGTTGPAGDVAKTLTGAAQKALTEGVPDVVPPIVENRGGLVPRAVPAG